MKYLSIAFLAAVLLLTPWILENHPEVFAYLDKGYNSVGVYLQANFASAILHSPVTVDQLKTTYDSSSAASKVRVLIVPGHEPDYGGAEYKDLKERDMTVELGQDLEQFLDQNGHYQTYITRDTQAWNPVFANYFTNEWNSIISWEQSAAQGTSSARSIDESPSSASNAEHITVPDDVAYRLYGITKWANENNIQVEIHIHFNDDPDHAAGVPGKYSGFAIYVPATQYNNSSTTKAIADTVYKRLAKYNPVSDLKQEADGIVDEPDLIAIGANNTANAASMLIEYSYIYEPEFADPAVRSAVIKDMAFQTYLGLQDFFGSGNDVSFAYDTLTLPHTWKSILTETSTSTSDILALQSALILDGDFPALGMSKNDCPRTGKIGPCTLASISQFQKKYSITGEQGIVGPKTEKVLNMKYSVQVL